MVVRERYARSQLEWRRISYDVPCMGGLKGLTNSSLWFYSTCAMVLVASGYAPRPNAPSGEVLHPDEHDQLGQSASREGDKRATELLHEL